MIQGNPIRETTRRLIAELDRQTLELAEAGARRHSLDATGQAMAVADTLELLAAARVLARLAGLDIGEEQAVRLLLYRYEVPEAVREHVLGFAAGSASFEHVQALFVPGRQVTRHLFWVFASLACFEGLRDDVRDQVESLGYRLGLGADLVRVLLQEAEVSVAATLRGDDATLRRLRQLRYAIFDFGMSS